MPEKNLQSLKMVLVFATNNIHKVEEIRCVIGDRFRIITLQEAGINIDIPEPHDSLEANAIEKTRTIYSLTGQSCFGEDTGLEVAALNGEPGVMSARYAGEGKSSEKNVEKLLFRLEGHTRRNARFKTVIALIIEGKEWLFDGTCEGSIINSPKGNMGFGYDPVFVPEGEKRTFAEMTMEEKIHLSHRSKATYKLVTFLQKLEIKSQN